MQKIKDILEALKSKEAELTETLKELKEVEYELAQVKAAIKALSKDAADVFLAEGLNHKPYNPNATWKEKIKQVVALKGQAGIKTIAKYISEVEKLKFETVYAAVAVNASTMLALGEIKAKTVNGKNEYFL